MNRKRRFTQKKLHLIASCLCILCLPVLCLLAYMAEQSSTPLILQSKGDYTPKQDADGYYSSFNDTDAWQVFLFTVLEEDARISDLHIRNSFFRTTYEECCYEDNDECTAVVPASALCLFNNGVIENCDVHARILGAWSAGGIVANNYGEIIDCHFSGSVEAGLAQHMEQPENRLGVHTLFAGGICCGNEGLIRNCVNDGNITLQSLPEDYYLNYAAGGIAGSSRGAINRCVNSGSVHVEEAECA